MRHCLGCCCAEFPRLYFPLESCKDKADANSRDNAPLGISREQLIGCTRLMMYPGATIRETPRELLESRDTAPEFR
jgi:hypothetical protein